VTVPAPRAREDGEALADALALRALGRLATGAAGAGTALGLLALVFVLLAGGRLDATSLPQLVVLGAGQVAGLYLAAEGFFRSRRVGALPGSGPGEAAAAAFTLSRAVVVVPAMGLALALGSIAVLTPRSASAFSAALALALLVQLTLVLHVLRRGLARAGRPRTP
jgi:hypothetical protein